MICIEHNDQFIKGSNRNQYCVKFEAVSSLFGRPTTGGWLGNARNEQDAIDRCIFENKGITRITDVALESLEREEQCNLS